MNDYNYEGCTRLLAGCAAIFFSVLCVAVVVVSIIGFFLAQKGG